MGKIFNTLAGVYAGDHETEECKKWRDLTPEDKKVEDVFKKRLLTLSLLLIALTGTASGFVGCNIIPKWSLAIICPVGIVILVTLPIGIGRNNEGEKLPLTYSKEYKNIVPSTDTDFYSPEYPRYSSLEACKAGKNYLEEIENMDGLKEFLGCKEGANIERKRNLGPLVRHGLITPKQARAIIELYNEYCLLMAAHCTQAAANELHITEVQLQLSSLQNGKQEILKRHKDEASLLGKNENNEDRQQYQKLQQEQVTAKGKEIECLAIRDEKNRKKAFDIAELDAKWLKFKQENALGI